MNTKTLETILRPDGRVSPPPEELPDHPVQVMVTFLEADEEISLTEPGDYLDQLTEFCPTPAKLSRGTRFPRSF
ncbi:MAG TPA: hypothetical protein VNK04_12650 [Gemmataceae bacterium]|nr:hypothetical protein [Gemmataceae bacterium]